MAADVADLNPDFQSRLMAMINASGGRLTINSGYRSVAEQTALWNANPNPRMVAYPGTSMHNKGLAADLGGDIQWAHDHAAQFGLYFPMGWEPWHVQPIGIDGASGGNNSALGQTQPPPQQNDLVHGLEVVAQTIAGTPSGQAPTVDAGRAPTVQDPLTTSTDTTDQTATGQQGASQPSGAGGDLDSQLRAGFERAGRHDLAAMVGSPAFKAWINAESGGDPEAVGPANQYSINGHGPGGLFQFLGHSWADQYYQGGRFTMSPADQAYYAATKFNLTPSRIEQFANEIASGSYRGWG